MNRLRTIKWCGMAVLCLGAISGLAPGAPPTHAATSADGSGPVAAGKPDSALRSDLGSPSATLATFLDAMRAIEAGKAHPNAAWRIVYRTLDTSRLQQQASDPTRLRTYEQRAARNLFEVLRKLGVTDSMNLPDAASVEEQGISRYTIFPRYEAQKWVWDDLGKFNRWPDDEVHVVLARSDGQWRFAPKTVTGIFALAESLAPLPPKQIAAQPATPDLGEKVRTMLGPTFVQTQWWQWLALLGCIFVGLAVGRIVSRLIAAWGDRRCKRGWMIRGVTLQSLANPVSLALLTIGLAIGLHVFIRLDVRMAQFVNRLLKFLYLLALGWACYNLVSVLELGIRRVTSKKYDRLDSMLVPLIRKTLRVFIVVVFALVVAHNVFGLNIAGWLAGLGIAGLAVSLAAQDSVKNVFGSLTVFFDKPFAVGDYITFDGQSGTVEEIGFRSTRLRLLSGAVVTIPNMKWIDNKVENVAARPGIRREMNITVTYDTPAEKIDEAVAITRDVLTDDAVVDAGRFDMDKQPPRVAFDTFNADSLNIKAYYWYQFAGDADRGFFTYMDHCQQVNMMLFRRFAEAGIEFAFPTQTLYLAGDTRRPLSLRLEGDGGGGNRGDGEEPAFTDERNSNRHEQPS